jgi:hypothetical protein
MGKVRLDQGTADRMLAGVVDPADVPPGFEAVAELLAAVRAATRRPVHAGGSRGPAVVDARRSGGQTRRRQPMFTTTPLRPRLSILAVAMALSATTGAAFAAGLPADAAGPASAVLHRLGIGAPAARTPAPATHPANHGATVSATATTTAATGSAKGALISGTTRAGKTDAGRGGGAAGSGSSHGKTISTLARTTEATGAAKGATISAAASGGKSHAGEHGHGASGHGASGHGGGKPSGAGHGHSHHAG